MSEPALEQVHLIGIGGAGMSGIARILLARGARVSGSDAKDSLTLAALRALGAEVYVGHRPEQLGEAKVVVVSTAIRPSNPELAAAQARGLTVLARAAALRAVMTGRRRIAVAGTAGKTTTTSMLTVILQHAGRDPSYAIGGDLNEPGSGAHHGTGELFVAEADESDGSFLLLEPDGAVVTNVAADHLDYYGDLAAVQAAFAQFTSRVPEDGFVVCCADDAGAMQAGQAALELGRRVVSYGFCEQAALRISGFEALGVGSRFELVATGRRLGPVELAVPGRHNAANAAAAAAASMELGCAFAEVVAGLGMFSGARRRFEDKGSVGGVRVVDDYAHHPIKLRAALSAARPLVVPGGRLVAVFQPHLYSRTQSLAAEFGTALALADLVVVMEVYAAREDPIPGVTGALVADAVPLPADRVFYEPSWSAVPDLVAALVRPGDLVLTLGAGDVTMLGPEILARVPLGA
ncbi:MAG: UDP-N-acetylmuramate--L-alanine ligase [Mycobacteriales bacterium]